MKIKAHILLAVTLGILLSACGSNTPVRSGATHGSVVKQKTDRAAKTAERRIDQHTDNKVDRAIDRLFNKL